MATDKGANAGLKVASLIGLMVAGADSIDDMAVLRHGGMSKVFSSAYAPSTLGSFLRAFTFRARAAARRDRRPVPDWSGRTHTPARLPGRLHHGHDRRVRPARCRRHDHRGPRPPETGRRVRLHPSPWPQRVPGHAHHYRARPGHRGPAAAQGLVRVPAWREAADRRRRHTDPPLDRSGLAGPGPDGLRVLRWTPPCGLRWLAARTCPSRSG